MKSMTRPIPMLIWGLILFCIVGICLALGRASGANVELGPSVQFSEEELRGAKVTPVQACELAKLLGVIIE